MRLRQYIKIATLIVALTGLSSMVAAEGGSTSDDERGQPDQKSVRSTLSYQLTPEQMDKVYGGMDGDYWAVAEARYLICAYIGCGPYPIGVRDDSAR